MSQMLHSLIIKNHSLRWQEVAMIILALALSIAPVVSEVGAYISLIGLFLLAFALIQLVPRLLDKSPQIIIDQRGIEFCKKQRLHSWNTTDYAYIKKEVEGSGKYSQTVHYFYIKSQGQKFKEDISHLKFNAADVSALIEHYGSGNVGDENDQFRDEVASLMQNPQNAPQIIRRFKRHKLLQDIQSLVILLVVMGIAIYFQATTSYWFSVGAGFVCSVVLTWVLFLAAESVFKSREYVRDLSDEEFYHLTLQFGLRLTKATTRGIIIFLAISTIIIFIISYLATRP